MSKAALTRSIGVALILAGIVIGGGVVYSLVQQGSQDTAQDKAWQQFSGAAQGQAPGASPAPSAPPVGLAAGLYLKMTLPKIGREAVAVDGDWSSLKSSSTVHYRASPAPGQKGNMLIAFHREPKWIDMKIAPGDIVRIDALDRNAYQYQVDFVKIVSARDVGDLKPTTGTDLTLITCDPPWQDYNRMVVRAHLMPPG